MYTNGFDYTTVVAALKDRIGFRQPLGTGAPTLSSAVTTTASGRYFDDFHALVTIDNLKACIPLAAASDANLITMLGNLRSSAIMKALNGIFPAPQVVDQPTFAFERLGRNDQLQSNTGLFVGFEINVANSHDAAVQIDTIRLFMDGEATFNLYLFKDGKAAAEKQVLVTTEAGALTDATPSEWILGRGKWFVGYFQDDLGSVKAYREQACEWAEASFYKAEPMQADATGATTFDRENISYPVPSFGINIELSSFRDYTKAIVKKAPMFDELIGLIFAYNSIEMVIYAVRSNGNERILKDQLQSVGIQLDLNGVAPISDSPQAMGLKQRIDKELKRVQTSFYPNPKSVVIDAD